VGSKRRDLLLGYGHEFHRGGDGGAQSGEHERLSLGERSGRRGWHEGESERQARQRCRRCRSPEPTRRRHGSPSGFGGYELVGFSEEEGRAADLAVQFYWTGRSSDSFFFSNDHVMVFF
jgi:hypothetical protein